MLVAVMVYDRGTGRLRYETRQALADRKVLRPGVRLYEGVPFRQTPGHYAYDQQYVVVAHPFANQPGNQTAADQHWKRLATELPGLPLEEFLDHMSSLITGTSRSDASRDLWSLMLIRFARSVAAREYWAGHEDLGRAFLRSLRPAGDQLPRTGPTAHRLNSLVERILNPTHGIAHFVADQQLVALLDLQQEARLKQLARVHELGETYIMAMLFVAGLLTGVSEIVVLDVALQAFIGYIQFLSDLEELEQDGELTEEEADSIWVWLSFAGIFLPFGRYFKLIKNVDDTLGITALLLIAHETIRWIASVIFDVFEAAQRLLAADEAGFSTYLEMDVSNTVFIPRPTTGNATP